MINTALLKEQLKRFWGLSALLFMCYALFIALPIYTDRRGWSLASLLNMENAFMILSILFAPLIAVIVLFKFQNQVKSVTAMNSYPITRNQLLTTNALASMILLVLPLLAFCVIMIFPVHRIFYDFLSNRFQPMSEPMSVHAPIFPMNPQFGALPNSIFVMSRFFFITALSYLFYLSVYMVAATLSGNSLITLLLCAALPFLPIGLHMLATAIKEFYVFGFFSQVNTVGYLVYMHPILFSLNRERDWVMLFQMISYFTIIIAMAACCVFAANKRAQERAGDSIVFPYVKNVLVFILSVCGLLLLGFIFIEIFWSATAMYIGFVLGFFLAYCIAQMIAEKTFNILNKMKDFIKFGAIALGIMLLIVVSTRSDVFGYERHIPHLANIEGVQILDVNFLFDERDKLNNTTLNELLVKDTEIINEIITLHQTIINERGALRQLQLARRRGLGARVRQFNILYKLNNGNVVVRSYYLPMSFMTENDVHRLQIRSQLSMSLLQNRPDLINGIDIDPLRSYLRDEYLITRHDHILELIDALMKDYDLLIHPKVFERNNIHVRIVFEPEDLVFRFWWMDSLSFEIGYDGDRSYVRDWLFEKEYISVSEWEDYFDSSH